MAQVDARKAGRTYKAKSQVKKGKDVTGRKEPDGTEAVIKLDELRRRTPELITLRIAMGQAAATYNDAVKAVAKASGLLSVTVNKFIRSRAGDTYLEDKAKAAQLELVFSELPPLKDPDVNPRQPELGAGLDPDDEDDSDDDEGVPTGPGAVVGDQAQAGVH